MKYILVFIIIIFSFCADCQNGDYFIIKHIGEQEKPIYPFAIAKVKSDTEGIEMKMRVIPKFHVLLYNVMILDSVSYNAVDSVVEKYKHKVGVNLPELNYWPYGTLEIMRYSNQKEDYFFQIKRKEDSYSFFQDLYFSCKSLQIKEYKEGNLLYDMRELYLAIDPSKLPPSPNTIPK